jgi:subtilase family serine protease
MTARLLRSYGIVCTLLAFALPLSQAASAQASTPLPKAVAVGEQAPDIAVTGTVWLTLRNQPALDAAVAAMYTSGSASYHNFARSGDLKQYAPTDAEINAVKQALTANHLVVLGVHAGNLGVQFTGSTSDF